MNISVIIGYFIGVIIGYFIRGLSRSGVCGYLRVDHSDPSDPPLLFLELETDLNAVVKKKEVRFKVKVENFVSHN